ncbi:fungal-specific transcription factor domain-domain-containing protein [Absidia repens]|uniref:Fungal-specific transcription factor domain-domain-containing protein n=1 Tax=Absidia repens TaxID=90262 RepID=A0A1X2IQJ3_9FUNG|nr:fungal-specific transcription factor domain-domain-containing protein [Absidia repens]
MSTSGDEASLSKRQRVSRACDLCRRKKIKCDGLIPVCSNCRAFNLECSYKDATKKRGPPKGYIEAIETRLHKLESLLGNLAQDDPKSKLLLDELNSPLETANGDIIKTRPVRRKQDSLLSEYHGNSTTPPSSSSSSSSSAKARRIENAKYASTPSSSSTTTNKASDHSPLKSPATLCESPTNSHTDLFDTPSSPESVSDSNGQLSMDEGGHVRYLGRSSGFYLLQSSRTYQNGVFHFSGYGPKSTSTPRKSDHHVDPLALPPKDLSEHLVRLYFKHFYPLLPLFYKRQLVNPDDLSDALSPLLLNAIYAIASRVSPDARVRSDPASQDTAGDIFFERAKCLLDDYYDVPRISTVQALLLLSSHQQGALKSARAWLYCGMAFRMALDLGLHRNCDHWQIPPDEKERRKRVFWCSFIVDRLTTAIYGRALCFEERDIDVPFPSVDDDEPIQTENNQPAPRILDTFIHSIKLCDILGHVLKNIYYAKARHHASGQHVDHVLKTLHQQLTEWLARLPPSLQYKLPDTEMGETVKDPPLAVGQMHMIYYTTMILLHRSFIPGPSQAVESQLSMPSYDLCVSGAKSILNIINIMLGENHLRYVVNYSVYFAFTAGIIFIKMASSSEEFDVAFDAKVNVNKIMHALDQMEATWSNAGRCCNILGELAGLRDINLECDEYVPRRLSKAASPPPAIAVPNSPEPSPLDNDDSTNTDSAAQATMDLSSTQQVSSTNNMEYGNSSNTSFLSSNANQQQQPQPFITPMTATSDMDPFAVPGSVMNSQDQPQQAAAKFDPFGTAFWGVPTSLNTEEWNQYFAQGVTTPTSLQPPSTNVDHTPLLSSIDISTSSSAHYIHPFYSSPYTPYQHNVSNASSSLNSSSSTSSSTLSPSISSPSSSAPQSIKKEPSLLGGLPTPLSLSLPDTPARSYLLGYTNNNNNNNNQ